MQDLVAKWRQHIQQNPAAVNDVRILLDDPSSEIPSKWLETTPLLELVDGAIRPGHPDRIQLIKLLLEQGADPNARDPLGQTALLLACCIDTRNDEIVNILLKHGADPNIASKHGTTAWSCIKDAGGDEAERIRGLLLKYGTRID